MSPNPNWKAYAVAGLLLIASTLGVAVATRLWVLTAVPLGFAFGFFLQKGDLCGASAFSAVVLDRDWNRAWGLWTSIVVAMSGFAVLDILGLVTLNVKPMIWVSYVVGGALFGCGMVLAGGCVSGCLFKAATGNLNAIAALLTIPLGIAAVEHGPLAGLNAKMKSVLTTTASGAPLGLPSVTGIPYWVLVLGFVAATVAWTLHRRRATATDGATTESTLKRVLTRPWKPWQSGLAIGLVASLAYLSSAASGRNYPLGVTHGVLHAQLLVTEDGLQHVYQKPSPDPAAKPTPAPAPGKKVVWWLILLVGSLMVGSFFSARMSGQARLLPKPPEQVLFALLGGLLVGAGAAFAKGCVIGNIHSGWALMSLGTVLFGIVTVLSNWATTRLYLVGR